LTVRVAALLLIALALAKPAVTSLKALWGRGQTTAVAVVLDNSASMAILDGGQPRFDTARHAVEQLLDILHDGDSIALLPTGGPPAPEYGKLYHTHETVRQALSQCQVSYERADLAGKLQQARSLLAQSEAPNKEIYVITDNQTISWAGLKEPGSEPAEQPSDVPVVLIDVNRDPVPNVALRNLVLRSPAPVTGVPIQVGVEVYNASTVPQQKHLELHVDGSKEAVSPTLAIPSASTLKHEFTFTVDRPGAHRGEVRLIGDDGSALDNRLFFALTVDQQIPVAIVKPRRHEIAYAEDSFYLEKALAPSESDGWALRVTTLTPEQLANESLAGYAVVYCVNLPALDLALSQRLRDYVSSGGHVFWICGRNVEADAYNRMNEQANGQLLPAPLAALREPPAGKTWRLGSLDKEHPALAPLTEPVSIYQSVLVHKHFPFVEATPPAARTLARLDDGQPLLLERSVGAGSVLALGTGVHVEWTNLPLKPLFLPLFARLTFHLAGAESNRTQVLAGAPFVVPLGERDQPVDFEIVRPSGDIIRLHGQETNGRTFRYTDTHEAGIYLLRMSEEQRQKTFAFAVNIDPEEADPSSLSREELQARFGKQPFFVCDNPDDVTGTIRRLREGRSLWELFLAAVLVGLVLEAFIANRLSSKTPPPVRTPAGPVKTDTLTPMEEEAVDFLEKM
jgi:hypothetical protein